MKNRETKSCQNCKKDFIVEPEDFNFYEKMKVPPPTWCPTCRAMRRLIWRNERSLYHNTCAMSREKIISMFSPETGLTVYERDNWWSDKWDPTAYGKEYNFSRPFFEQWKELLSKVPLGSLGNTNVVHSEYGNHNVDLKNCYLTYASFGAENSHYSRGIVGVKDSFDLYDCLKVEKSYENVLCTALFNTHFSYDSDECIDSSFLISSTNLQNCLGCINLRHKSNCIFNKEYTKEEYEKERAKYDFGSYQKLEQFKQKYTEFLQTQPRRFAFLIKCINVTGDYVINAKNCREIFDCYDNIKDSKYIIHTMNAQNIYDGYGIGEKSEYLYEGVDFGDSAYEQRFGVLTHTCVDTHYTYMCYSGQHLFGCIGIRERKYCILNRQYTKEEYEELVPKIIEHMNEMPYIDAKGRVYKYGEFFPTDFSPFYYNETIGNEYFPLSEKQTSEYGFSWKEREKRAYQVEIDSKELPDHIKDVSEDIVGKVIGCLHKGECDHQCTQAFKIRLDELEFLKRMNIALPRLCPNCRHFTRLSKRNPVKLWHRSCMCEKDNHTHGAGKCEVEFETSYAPDRSEIVYCEKCYQQEVY